MSKRMPAIFFGHGNPMNALAENSYTREWGAIGRSIPRPKAVLSITAHWYIPGCAVTANPWPSTIHDFGGFPAELFAVEYPAPGSSALAARIKELLAPLPVDLDLYRGLDHGSWTVLKHVLPAADIPVVQLSIDSRQPPLFHYQLGQRLTALREEGVLVIGSGNLVHNLATYAWDNTAAAPFDWAVSFESRVRELLLSSAFDQVVAYGSLGREAQFAVPTPDHYLPLLYILGLRREGEQLSFPLQGFDGGSISMLAVRTG